MMIPKPKHLGPEYAAQFQDRSVVIAYEHRPPYPVEVFDILIGLITDGPRAVLDVGCGTGKLARKLVERVDRVDAVDWSQAMIEMGKQLPGGDHPKLAWIHGRAEDASLHPPYALIVAGASLHWMDWYIVLPRFRKMLTSHGYLAITGDGWLPSPWDAEVQQIIPHYSTNQDYQPYNLVEELTWRGLFETVGAQETAPVRFIQSIDSYIESFHARNGFSRERMSREAAAAFDAAIKEVVLPFAEDGQIELQLVSTVAWGKPSASIESIKQIMPFHPLP